MSKKKTPRGQNIESGEVLEPVFRVLVKTAGLVYETVGDTVVECFEKLKIDRVKMDADITVETGGKSVEMNLRIPVFRRFIINRLVRQLWADRFTDRLA